MLYSWTGHRWQYNTEHALCILAKAEDIHSEYVILIAFPLQEWLHERTSTLLYTYITCLVNVEADSSGTDLGGAYRKR